MVPGSTLMYGSSFLLRGGRRRIENRAVARPRAEQKRQADAGQHETGGQHRGNACEQIARRAAGHEATATATDAKSATLAALQQDDADQADGEKDVDDEDDGDHGLSTAPGRGVRNPDDIAHRPRPFHPLLCRRPAGVTAR
jgi:hypothetical protein